jgi:hypothetical protein
MNSPIGFRTGKNSSAEGSIMEIRPAAAGTDTMSPRIGVISGPSASRISDYAYRIAALTAGIALLASIW